MKNSKRIMYRDVVLIKDYGVISGKLLKVVVGGNVNDHYIIQFDDDVIPGHVLDEGYYSEIDYVSELDDWYNHARRNNIYIPEVDYGATHQLAVAILRGQVIQETTVYRYVFGIQQKTERCYLNMPKIEILELYAYLGDDVIVANANLSKSTIFNSFDELQKAINSGEVKRIIE